jgi:hypothetical protein
VFSGRRFDPCDDHCAVITPGHLLFYSYDEQFPIFTSRHSLFYSYDEYLALFTSRYYLFYSCDDHSAIFTSGYPFILLACSHTRISKWLFLPLWMWMVFSDELTTFRTWLLYVSVFMLSIVTLFDPWVALIGMLLKG